LIFSKPDPSITAFENNVATHSQLCAAHLWPIWEPTLYITTFCNSFRGSQMVGRDPKVGRGKLRMGRGIIFKNSHWWPCFQTIKINSQNFFSNIKCWAEMKASFPKGLIPKKCETEKNEKNVLKVYFLFNRFKPFSNFSHLNLSELISNSVLKNLAFKPFWKRSLQIMSNTDPEYS